MKRILVILFVAMLFFVGCSVPVVITGDSKAAGAEIYVDGRKIGVMQTHQYKGEEIVGTDVRVKRGKHAITFVSGDGKRIEKERVFYGENYIHVDFEKMEIR